MHSTQTLHDFVLNLLTNPQARAAFELDPEGMLHDAGLSDITAADVQDVVPLVVDYAPVQGITALAPVGEDLGLSALNLDQAGVIGQLQGVAQQFTVGAHSTSADVNVAALGAITVDPAGLGVGASALGIGVGVTPQGVETDLSGVHDVAETLDQGVVGPVGAEATGAVDTTVGTADGVVNGATDGLLGGAAHGALGGTVDGVLGTADGVLGTAGGLVGGTVNGQLGATSGLVDSLNVGGLGVSGLQDASVPAVNLPQLHAGDDDSSLLGGVTQTAGETLQGTGVGGGLLGGIGVQGEAHSSADAGVLGITDGLL